MYSHRTCFTNLKFKIEVHILKKNISKRDSERYWSDTINKPLVARLIFVFFSFSALPPKQRKGVPVKTEEWQQMLQHIDTALESIDKEMLSLMIKNNLDSIEQAIIWSDKEKLYNIAEGFEWLKQRYKYLDETSKKRYDNLSRFHSIKTTLLDHSKALTQDLRTVRLKINVPLEYVVANDGTINGNTIVDTIIEYANKNNEENIDEDSFIII